MNIQKFKKELDKLYESSDQWADNEGWESYLSRKDFKWFLDKMQNYFPPYRLPEVELSANKGFDLFIDKYAAEIDLQQNTITITINQKEYDDTIYLYDCYSNDNWKLLSFVLHIYMEVYE